MLTTATGQIGLEPRDESLRILIDFLSSRVLDYLIMICMPGGKDNITSGQMIYG